jgi:hypothetical protein
MNLSWKLALVSKGHAAPALLDTYAAERAPVLRETLQLTTSLFGRVTTTGARGLDMGARALALRQLGVHCRWSRIVRDELAADSDRNAAQSSETKEEGKGTDVEPLSAYGADSEASGTRVHAGDRAPDAPGLVDTQSGASTRLFELLEPARHTVLVFDAAMRAAVERALAVYPLDAVRIFTLGGSDHAGLVDTEGHARRVYGVEAGARVIVIRPDGVVGALLKDSNGVGPYFKSIFG